MNIPKKFEFFSVAHLELSFSITKEFKKRKVVERLSLL